ncbi:hypothetical protein D3C76_968300 [compost metagenome]
MHQGLFHQRVLLEARLDRRRSDVLATGGDDQFLLAPGEPEVAFVVQSPQVAGAQPAIIREGLGGFVRLPEVALEHQRAAHQDLAVFAYAQLHAGQGAADRTGLA